MMSPTGEFDDSGAGIPEDPLKAVLRNETGNR